MWLLGSRCHVIFCRTHSFISRSRFMLILANKTEFIIFQFIFFRTGKNDFAKTNTNIFVNAWLSWWWRQDVLVLANVKLRFRTSLTTNRICIWKIYVYSCLPCRQTHCKLLLVTHTISTIWKTICEFDRHFRYKTENHASH